MTRTLVATVLLNSKRKEIYCKSNQINDQQLSSLRSKSHRELEEQGFTFIDLVGANYADIKGYAIFFEGHADEMNRILRNSY